MQELNLRILMDIFLQRLKWLILATVIVALLAVGFTALFEEDTYTADCSMYVMNLTVESDGQVSTSAISTSNLSAAQEMVEEYIALLRTDMVIDDVAAALRGQGYALSNDAIRGSLSMYSKSGTALLIITSTTGDPALSKAICDCLMEVAPEKVKQAMLNLGTINPVDHANLGVKTAARYPRTAVVGAAVGFVLCYGICLLLYLLDNTVKNEQDVKSRLNVTVLGMVPDLHPDATDKKGGKKYGKR